ncbi:TetR/AcrR family transcriptional regulator [Shewanella corallii]|uniref:TetR/AcrR family transcriptional regulator n=1 Tax=Shewanella corallii TaxID=560080 RepID=A0ABT0NAL6_9GAMM|nr:TetR/AcrR family transcriptional regulator [Shewanella corallii]MCL2915504.1 TetR/AcrR family transcriptional regulator [Shewanella corallii]
MTTNTRRPKEGSKQALKSANTQEAFLKATLDCYVSLGYILTTTTTVAKHTGLSRGAMMHHFPSKRALVEASIDYLNKERIRVFLTEIGKLSKQSRRIVGLDGLEVYWKLVNSKLYTAYFELRMASRTDKELAQILKNADSDFEKVWLEKIKEVFPEWCEKDTAQLSLAMDLTQSTMEGLAQCHFTNDSEERKRRVLLYTRRAIRDIYDVDKIVDIIEGEGPLSNEPR